MDEPRLRVAAVVAMAEVSGPGRQLAAAAAALAGRGVEVRVFLLWRTGRPRPPYAGYLEAAGITLDLVRDDRPLDLRLAGRLRKRLAAWNPHVVQTHGYKATAAAFALRRSASWRWVGFYHGHTTESVRARLYHWLDRWMLRRADRIVVMSRPQALQFAGAPVQVIANATILLPEPTAADAALPGLEGGTRPRIGAVGRLSPEKGVDLFLEACATLRAGGLSFSALVVGDGPERSRLERLSAELGLDGTVRFAGLATAMRRIYAALDLLVLPSRSEGLPNVLLEALSADLPVVATRVGAVPDVLSDPQAGVLVPPGNATALARGIREALATEGEARRAARASASARFSLERRVEEHLALYHSLASRPAPDGASGRERHAGAVPRPTQAAGD